MQRSQTRSHTLESVKSQRSQQSSQAAAWAAAIPEETQEVEKKVLAPKPFNLSRGFSDKPRKPTGKILQKRRNSAPTLAPMPERVSEDGHSEAESAPLPSPMPLHSPPSVYSESSAKESEYTLGLFAPKEGSTYGGSAMPDMTPIPTYLTTTGQPRSNSFSSKVSKQESILGVTPQDTISEYDGSPGSLDRFKPLRLWEERDLSACSLRPAASLSLFQPIDCDPDYDEIGFCDRGMLRGMVIAPSSVKRSLWDLLSLLFVIYDAIVIPLQFLRFPQSTVITTFSWMSRLFWSFDVFASFITGYALHNGSIEVRPSQIFRRYLKGWMVLDITMVISDWLEVLLGSEGDALQSFQMFRMLRLMRLTRIQRVLDMVVDRASSEKVGVLVSLMRSVCGIILITHVMACCWVGLGTKAGSGWVYHNGLENELWQQYAIGFHWSLTQFYGAMELEPSNLGERFYAIGSLLAGFVIATAFVSGITSSMTRLYIITSKQSGQFKVLSRYLKEHGISRKLATRVQKNAQHAIEEQSRNVPEDDVELLKDVSAPLRVELHFEIFSPVLLEHPLFVRLQDSNPAMVRQICHTAVSIMTLSRDDVLFSRGEVPARPEMLFVCSGELAYSQDGERFQDVLPGEWICEHVLWTKWVFHGLLYAVQSCRLAVLDAEVFGQMVSNCPNTTAEMSSYAEQFLKLVNNSPNTRSDLGSSMDLASLMVLAYPRASEEVGTGFAAFGGSWWPRRMSKSQILPVSTLTSVAVTA